MSDVLKADQGALWLQRQAGKAPEYVGCTDLDDIAEPQGDVTLSMCRDANGRFVTRGRSIGAPGAPTTSFTAWVFPEKSILDEIADAKCPIYLYALTRDCGRADVFDNYVRGRVLSNAVITNITDSNLVKRTDTGEQAMKFDLSADYPVARLRKLNVSRQSIAETAALNDVAFCDEVVCAGACGPQSDAGKVGFAVASPQTGSPGPSSNAWFTDDAGLNWGVGTTDPFAAAEDIISAACFDQSVGVVRHLVAREPNPAKAAMVAYSDNDGATWTLVTVGTPFNEGASDQGALFAMDRYHIWYATNKGNVYFSSDGGASWTLLDSATASSGNALNVIWFADYDNGYAVGKSGTIIQTTDGGDTWAAIVDPSGGDSFTALHVFDRFRFIAGTSVGGIWQTWDEGDNFTEQSGYVGYAATNVVQDIKFYNDVVGFMVVDTTTPVGKVYLTVNGGYDWKELTTPTNAGLNALAVINANLAYAVGNAQGGSAVVLKISG